MANQPTDAKRKRVDIDLTKDGSSREDEAPALKHVYEPSSQLAPQQHTETEREAWLEAANDVVDVDEIVSSTQEAAGNDELCLYGDLSTKVVGVRYYRGMANPGEYILMRREPGNPYDTNAIRVDNVAGQQIGHIPRRIAKKLAPYMDRGWLYVEGRLASTIGTFDCDLSVDLLGPEPSTDAGRHLVERMAIDKLPTRALKMAEQREKEPRRAAAGAGGTGRRIPSSGQSSEYSSQSMPGMSSQPIIADLVEASQRFNPRELGSATDQYGLQEEVLRNMPLATRPSGIKTEMLPHQLQALRWLLHQENPSLPASGSRDTVQLWKRQADSHTFVNIATNHPQKDEPRLASGGILADDMGLGKTLEMIALMVADIESNDRGTTLVVAPLSVMSNWSGQINLHMHQDKALKVHTYHGAGRVSSWKAADFTQYDVIITTYQTLASDFGSRGKVSFDQFSERKLRSSGLYSVGWRRIILDEGHIVRNPASKGAAAVNGLVSRSRWCLTGTPIVNSLKDLYSLLKFVGLSGGTDQLAVFNSVLIRPLRNGDPSAVYLLQAIMAAFTLRRHKEMAFIDLRLPKLDEYMHPIQFTDKEKQRYEALVTEARGLLKNVRRKAPREGETKVQAYQHLLEILLRMRQCCNHWQLCGERVTSLLAQLEAQKTVDLTPENEKALQDMLQVQIESHEDCPVCLESLHEPVITTCAHVFGRECISKVIETQHKCPMCRADLPDGSVLVGPANDCGDDSADDEIDLTQSSSKLEAMMQILSATKASANGDKTVVFSQWTRFLDIVQARLDRENMKYCRVDGTMTATQRDAALQALGCDPECTIMLASLGVCAVGLNLTAANQIILSDTWWAPAIEDQAVDRVHRLGQRKETRVFRLIMDGTIEQRTIEIQAEKRKLMQLAFSEKGSKRDKAKAGRLADIQRLLAPAPTVAA
ncbi:hypothetical protein BAUCODRAFT_101663 [Baudoinia panamericana UAMH 10762]|uniref:SNF2 family DNA-dependent ATPase domain-containing protein n=1 Tax=Baudoinia panamericana (strain UAMH 10762) TaxID=717646 RepID=M2LY96_BAUPA|nr:uncharacterized protein BAUCODRAFT_101663 [Baudoinia panamericana UAMH 10762]EMC99677.1 hypothetical protein BAUCODRAFT_101663 [Baudoinia panamericana UAMH 10762]